MKQKMLFISIVLCSAFSLSYSQLTVESCQKKAAEHYPLAKQYDLLQQQEQLNLMTANKAYLPQLSLSASGSSQSEVMQLPIKAPGMNQISKHQYQGTAQITQLLWDGGTVRAQKNISSASSEVDKNRNKVDMYALNERVNQLFFGILIAKEQLKQNGILQDELETNYNRIKALMQNGVANQADLDQIRVEQLNAEQRKIEMESTLQSYLEMLTLIIGEAVDTSTQLVKPDWRIFIDDYDTIKRPELGLFDSQVSLLSIQKGAVNASLLPRISLFGQGSFGYPGVNMFGDEPTDWLAGGIRLGWDLGGLYSRKNNFAKIENNIESIKAQKETFIFNSKQKTLQQKNDIEKYQALMKSDDEIIKLRNNVKKASEAKVENGTISVTDLIKDINAENLAIQNKSLHEIQLLMSIYNLKNTTNN